MHVKMNDTVVVISGNDKGKKGKILRIFPKDEKIVVEGVNYIWKHVRRTQQSPAGGRVQKEAPMKASKVLLYCPSCNKGVRVGTGGEKKSKTRVCKKCGGQL